MATWTAAMVGGRLLSRVRRLWAQPSSWAESFSPGPMLRTLREGVMRNRVTQVLSSVGRRLISAAALSALAGSIAASAQTTQTVPPSAPSNVTERDTFEVVSIHPVDLQKLPGGLQFGQCAGGIESTAGHLTSTGATVYRLVILAYGMSCG